MMFQAGDWVELVNADDVWPWYSHRQRVERYKPDFSSTCLKPLALLVLNDPINSELEFDFIEVIKIDS